METYLNLLILCNILLILPCFCENNHSVTNKIDEIKNYTIKNSFASDLMKNFTVDVLNKKLAESENSTSKPSNIKARKQVELVETTNKNTSTNNSTTNVAEQTQLHKNLNETISKAKIPHENVSKKLPEMAKAVNSSKNGLNYKNSTTAVKSNSNESKEKLASTTSKTIFNKDTTKANLQTVNLEDGSQISINSKNKTVINEKKDVKANHAKVDPTSTSSKPINLPTKATTIKQSNTNNNNINPSAANNTKSISTSTTTTTTTTTTSTTTPKPKKPKITYSQEDVPAIGLYAKKLEKNEHSKLPISAAIEEPIVQPVKEDLHGNHRDYILPIVAFIFAVPILMGVAIISYRRIKDYWSTRHYRRMDFLVDDVTKI